jgi:hypothetical protein
VKEGFKPEWEKMNTTAPSYVPKGLTAGDLLYYQKKASKEFYLRLRPILHQLSKLGNPRYAVNVVREALSFLKYIYKD